MPLGHTAGHGGATAVRPWGIHNPKSKIQNDQWPDAFSLVELIISLGILAVGLVGAMRVFPVGLQASKRSELSSRATIDAQRTLESLKLNSCSQLQDAETSEEALTVTTRVAQAQAEHVTDPNRLNVVDVTVGWTQDGRSRRLTFVTYVRCPTS